MKNIHIAIVAATVLSGSLVPMSVQAAQVKHRKAKAVVAGVAAYEVAKHSHNRFARKHAKAIGLAAGLAANHEMKKHDRKKHHG
jgi:hypothetical protein